VIEIRDLWKHYGRIAAVRGLSLELAEGEAVALLGSNGAGKTTLIKCVVGIAHYKGSIRVGGIDLKHRPKQAKSLIGYVPQEPAFYDMNLLALLRFFASLRRVGDQTVWEVLETVGLTPHTDKRVSGLSGGMKQRLSFALALLASPPVLVLDEPTSNLDASARRELLDLVGRLKARGRTVLFSSHRIDEVELVADRVVVMADGRAALECRPDELAERLGLRTTVHLSVPAEWVERLTAVLAGAGFEVLSVEGGRVTARGGRRDKAALLKGLVEGGIHVEDLSFTEPTMEEIITVVAADGSY